MQRINQKQLRKKILLNLFGDNMVTLPFGIGVTLAAVTSVFNLEPQLMFWFLSGMIGFLGPIGGVITKWSTSMGQLSRRALEELHAETYKAQEEELDKLQRELTGDGDIRTEQMLADLRSIHQSFKNDLANDSTTPSLRGELMSGELGLDIIYKIDQLFVESVRCLEDTIKLINKSEEATETVKSVILEKRESVISEVKQTINQLAQTYAELITSTSDDDPSRLSQLRNELDANIEFARTVDQNVRNLGKGDLFEQNEYDELGKTLSPPGQTQSHHS